jgi:hypothetical protein
MIGELFSADVLEKVFSPYVWEKVGPLLRKHGRSYIGIERPKGYRRQSALKACYRNAALIAYRGEATYVEGVCYNGRYGFHFHHAWVTLDRKNAIDPTLPNAPEYKYFGIEFPAELVAAKIISNNNYFSPLLDNPDVDLAFWEA